MSLLLARIAQAHRTPVVVGDPYWSNVVSLLNFPGVDASTTITDERSPIWTPHGTAQIDTSLGYNALQLDGSGAYISSTDSSDFDWFGSDYTMEAWVNPTSLSGWSYNDGPAYTVMLGHRNPTGFDAAWGFGPASNGSLQFRYYTGSTWNIQTAASLIALNALTHVEMSKVSNTMRLFVNGVQKASGTRGGSALQVISQPITVGKGNNVTPAGRIKAIRLTKGVGRHTADFTPPPAPFPTF